MQELFLLDEDEDDSDNDGDDDEQQKVKFYFGDIISYRDPKTNDYSMKVFRSKYNFVETPYKFLITKLSIHKSISAKCD